MLKLSIEYSIFVFVAACGVLQAAAAYSRLNGLLFFKRAITAYFFAGIAIGGAFAWFFASGDRNLPGIEGSQQFLHFAPAVFLAFVVTLAISSLVKRRSSLTSQNQEREHGLDALKEITYFQAISRSFGRQKGVGE